MLNSKTKVSNIKPIKVKKKKKPEPVATQGGGRMTLGSMQSDKLNTPIKKVSVNKLANI